MKYCADCADMEGNVSSHVKGMYHCYNPKSGCDLVSARKPACNYFTECFNSRRCETDREKLMAKSREYHCYIVTAVVTTLIIEDCLLHLNVFDYYRTVMLPNMVGGEEWLEDYDKFGPLVAEAIEGDEDKCSYLFETYIKPFTNLISSNQVDAARALYNRMYENLKEEYNIGTANKKLEIQAS